ncbi:hypothetical protein K493DRAFT_155909, partial [Basidiobolus meristosporus CBS 931.73]
NANVVKVIKVTVRKQTVLEEIITDVRAAFPALLKVQDGHPMFAVLDASGSFNL